MLLNEFLYFNNENLEPTENDRYNIDNDDSVQRIKDRRSRLTLRMLSDLRKAGEAREKEQKEDLDLVRVMYATPAEEEAAA
jgi:hypothetical protein